MLVAPPDRVQDLRELAVGRLGERVEELIDLMVERYRHEISAYAELDTAVLDDEVRATTRRNVVVVLDALGSGRRLGGEDLAELGRLGRRRAEQGFPLEAVLRAYHVGAWVAWSAFVEELGNLDLGSAPDVVSEVLSHAGSLVLDLATQVAGAVADAFMAATREAAVAGERNRHDAVDALLDGSARDAAGASEIARRLSLDPDALYAVMALEACDAGGPPGATPLVEVSVLADVLGCVASFEPVLVHTRGARAIGVYAFQERPPPGVLAAELRRELAGLVELRVPGAAVRGVLGLAEDGVEGIATSYAQASRALAAGRRLALPPEISAYIDLLPHMLLAGSPQILRDLRELVVRPLLPPGGRRAEALVDTLGALLGMPYLSAGEAAFRLGVHRHTLASRAGRIEALTGLKLKEESDRRILELGLLAHALTGAERRSTDLVPAPDGIPQYASGGDSSPGAGGDVDPSRSRVLQE